MSESTDWLSRGVDKAQTYMSELASDIWHGQAVEKHPYLVGAVTVASMAGGGGALWAGLRRAGTSVAEAAGTAEAGAAAAGSRLVTTAGETGLSGSAAASASEIASNVSAAESSASLYAKIMEPSAGFRSPSAPMGSSYRILASGEAREQIQRQAMSLRNMGARAELSPQQFADQLASDFRSNIHRVDADTFVARSRMSLFPGEERIVDNVIRADEGMALERVTNRTWLPGFGGLRGGLRDDVTVVRHFDLDSGVMRAYDFYPGSDSVLRSTVTADAIHGGFMSVGDANAELSPLLGRLYSRSASGQNIEGLHELIIS